MDKTPVKQSTINRLCLVCASTANRPSRIESTKSKYNLRDLLLKYGGINAESGLICRNCVNKLFGLHEKCVDFYNQCQSNYKRTVLKSKRLLPTTPSGASPRNLKRQNVSETPKNRAQTPSKIPTPIKTHTTPRTDQRSSKVRLNFGTSQDVLQIGRRFDENCDFIDETGKYKCFRLIQVNMSLIMR